MQLRNDVLVVRLHRHRAILPLPQTATDSNAAQSLQYDLNVNLVNRVACVEAQIQPLNDRCNTFPATAKLEG